MEHRLERQWFTPASTIGELSIDGAFQCFTLADVFREGDRVTLSTRLQTELPELRDVPNFTGSAFIAADTEGCVLVGRAREADRVVESRAALVPLLAAVRRGLDARPVTITVVNVRPAATPA